MWKKTAQLTYRVGRRIVVGVVGGTVVLVGVVLVFTPGPAVVVLPAGLAILSAEFAFARRWLRKLRDSAGDAWNSVRGGGARRQDTSDGWSGAPDADAEGPPSDETGTG